VIVAERSPLGLVAPVLFYGGLLLILTSLWVGQLTGWRESNVVLLPGRPASLLHDSRMSISLASSDAETGKLIVRSGAGDAVTRSLSPSGRARLGAVTIHRTGQGQAFPIKTARRSSFSHPNSSARRRRPSTWFSTNRARNRCFLCRRASWW
jgi:hypothetical protein